MSWRRSWLLTSNLALFLLLTATSVWAAEEGNQSPADSPIGKVFRWLNFAIVAGVLGFVIRKWMLPALRKRAEGIRRAIAEGGEAKAEAEKELRSIEARLARLDEEVAAMRAAAQRQSEAEATRIRGLAREESAKIERAGRAEIEAAERSARIELRRMAAQLTVSRAESFIREQINAATRAVLFRSFVADLGRRAN